MQALTKMQGPGGRSSVSGLKVCVFGNTGFAGRYVVNSFGRIGSAVVLPYRGELKVLDHLRVMGDLGQIAPVPYDPRQPASLDRAVEHSNVVINLIGKHYATRNYSMADSNVGMASAVAEACKRSPLKPRLIHVSRLGASADAPSKQQRYKYQGEQAIKSIYPEATILRPSVLFGDEDRFFNVFGTMARFWPFVPVVHGSRKLAPLSVFNLAEAALACVERDETIGQTYEIAGPHVYEFMELFSLLMKQTRLEPRVLEIPEQLARPFARALSHFRTPLISEDEIDLMSQNDVPDGSLPGLADLGIQPLSIEEVAINTLRKFRKPLTYYEVFEQ